jgi:lysozyme
MAKRKSKKKKQSGKAWWWLVPVIALAVAVIAYAIYVHERVQHAKFVRYPGFGIDMPDNYQIHGIDVSWFQNFVDWPSVKAMKVRDIKIGFAFIKATEGVGNVDRQFRRNWMKAQSVHLTRGAYHFFIPTKSGKAQAKNFISTVNLEPGDLPPVLDIEQLYGVSPQKMRKEIKDWLDTVEEYYKVKPIIYTYVSFYSRFLDGEFDEYPLWAAHYLEKDKPRIKRAWLFWQHSETGRVNGITTRVDFNVFNGDSSDFRELLIRR